MIPISNQTRLFIYEQPVNMRMSFEGLSGLIEAVFPGKLMQGYFIFLNRNRDRIKILYWDGDGFAMWYKRLERGSFLRQKQGASQLNRREFFMLLEGVTPKKIQRRFSLE